MGLNKRWTALLYLQVGQMNLKTTKATAVRASEGGGPERRKPNKKIKTRHHGAFTIHSEYIFYNGTFPIKV